MLGTEFLAEVDQRQPGETRVRRMRADIAGRRRGRPRHGFRRNRPEEEVGEHAGQHECPRRPRDLANHGRVHERSRPRRPPSVIVRIGCHAALVHVSLSERRMPTRGRMTRRLAHSARHDIRLLRRQCRHDVCNRRGNRCEVQSGSGLIAAIVVVAGRRGCFRSAPSARLMGVFARRGTECLIGRHADEN